MKEFTRSCSHILNLICFVLHLLLFSFQRSMLCFVPSACPVSHRAMLCRFFATAYLLYHFLFRLSRGFSKVFSSFFGNLFAALVNRSCHPLKRFFLLPLFGRSIIIALFALFVNSFLHKKMHKIRLFPTHEFTYFHSPSPNIHESPRGKVPQGLKIP